MLVHALANLDEKIVAFIRSHEPRRMSIFYLSLRDALFSGEEGVSQSYRGSELG